MEAHYIGFNLWVKAVEKAGTHSDYVDKVICRAASGGLKHQTLPGVASPQVLPNHLKHHQTCLHRGGSR